MGIGPCHMGHPVCMCVLKCHINLHDKVTKMDLQLIVRAVLLYNANSKCY